MIKNNFNNKKLSNIYLSNNNYSYQCRLNNKSNNGSPQTKYCNCFNCKNQKHSFHYNLPSSISDDLWNVETLLNKIEKNNCIKTIQNQQQHLKDKIINENKKTHQTVLKQNNLSLAAADEIQHLGVTIVELPNNEINLKKNNKHYLKKKLTKVYSTIDQNFLIQSNNSVKDSRRRTFSLGNTSWIRHIYLYSKL